jgi:predicted SAM-dependent methyltransferase
MHDTASISGRIFAQKYGSSSKVVLDVGGLNVNGSLREHFENLGMKYICIDIEEHSSVDIVVKPGEKLPFDNSSVDLIISTSCFEHDPCFWITFKEMTRIIKLGGYIYVNAPSDGPYHCHPGDNWRFYSDAGQALAYWSSYQFANEDIFPVKVIETFHILKKYEIWTDFVCVWERVEEKQTDIIVSDSVVQNIGVLENELKINGYETKKKI